MKKLLEEFKAFVMRGNVVDMAVGVIIATAFGKIVTSLVNDIFMPIIGVLIGNMDFSDLQIKLGTPVEGVEQAAIVVASLQKKKEEAPAPAPEPTKEEVLLTEIRDALNKIADK